MARLNWSPPPQQFKSVGARLAYEAEGDMARLLITSPDLGTVEVVVVGANKAAFEAEVAGQHRQPVDRLGHIRHRYVEAVS